MPAVKLDDWALPDINPTYTGTWSLVKTGPRSGYAILLSGGTFTLNTRSNKFEIWMVGGGGGGAAGDYYSAGGGGGGGGYSAMLLDQAVGAGTLNVFIGSGGIGHSSAQNNGTGGGATSISGIASLSAAGGSRAPYVPVYQKYNVGGAGGSGGGGGSGFKSSTRWDGGIGAINGAQGGSGRYEDTYTPGGSGSGVNMTPFKANGWYSSTPMGSGGQGACIGYDNYSGQLTRTIDSHRTWAGYQGWYDGSGGALYGVDATPNRGCGGGGSSRASKASNGGSGIVCIRWYD